MSKVAKKLIKASGSQLTSRLVLMFIAMAMMPFIIKHLGERHFGIWVLAGTISGYYGLLDLGLMQAVSRFVSRELGREDPGRANGYIATAFYAFCIVGAIALIISMGLYFLLPPLGGNAEDTAIIRMAIGLTGIGVAFSLIGRVFDGTLVAHMRHDLYSLVMVIITLLRSALIIAVLLQGKGVIALLIILALMNVIRTILVALLAGKVHSALDLGFSNVKRLFLRDLYGYASFSFIAQITDLMRFKSIPFIVSGFLGLEAVAPYSIVQRLQNLSGQLCGAVVHSVMPILSMKEGADDEAGIQHTFLSVYKIGCYLAVFVVGSVYVLGEPFLNWWLKDSISEIPVLVQMVFVAMAGTMMSCIAMPGYSLFFGTSKNNIYAGINALQGVATVVTAIIGVKMFGLLGAVVAESVIAILIKYFVQTFAACRIIKVPFWKFNIRHSIPHVCLAALFVGVAYFFLQSRIPPSFITLALYGGSLLLLYIIYVWFVGFTSAERTRIWALVAGDDGIFRKKR